MKRIKLHDLCVEKNLYNKSSRADYRRDIEVFLQFLVRSDHEDYMDIGVFRVINLGDNTFSVNVIESRVSDSIVEDVFNA